MTLDLRLGDAFIGLPELADGSVDVIITDPPFDPRAHRAALEYGDWRAGKRRVGKLPFPPLDAAQIQTLGHQLARVTRRWIVVFCGERQIETWAAALEDGGARFVRLGIALRTNPRPQLSGDRPAPAVDHLVIAHAGAERLRWNGRGRVGRWDARPARHDPGGQLHPTQKPLALLQALVIDFSQPGETVLDPFAGSGTTAVACRDLGRRFIGWEVDAGYHATALARLAGETLTPARRSRRRRAA